jgi:glycosyltransferase involved in cell wall biosynthesis
MSLRSAASGRPFLISYALGDDILRPLGTRYAKGLFTHALTAVDRFIAISEYTRDLLVRAGVPPSKIGIVQPPIDFERFASKNDATSIRAALPPHDLVLLTVSRLVYKKRIDRVITLMPTLLREFPNLLYVVVGEGEDGPRLRELADRSGVSDHVAFLGRVADDQLPLIYAAGDVFVLVTDLAEDRGEVEGFGIVFREAGSQEVPAIGPRTGGPGCAIQDGKTGFLVAQDDELLARLRQLLHDRVLRHRFGAAARALALRADRLVAAAEHRTPALRSRPPSRPIAPHSSAMAPRPKGISHVVLYAASSVSWPACCSAGGLFVFRSPCRRRRTSGCSRSGTRRRRSWRLARHNALRRAVPEILLAP